MIATSYPMYPSTLMYPLPRPRPGASPSRVSPLLISYSLIPIPFFAPPRRAVPRGQCMFFSLFSYFRLFVRAARRAPRGETESGGRHSAPGTGALPAIRFGAVIAKAKSCEEGTAVHTSTHCALDAGRVKRHTAQAQEPRRRQPPLQLYALGSHRRSDGVCS